MLIQLLPTTLLLLVSSSQANLIPRTASQTFTFANGTATATAFPSQVTQKCCFAVQDTVSQQWWEMTKFSYAVVNLTSMTTFFTVFPNTTVTRYENNTYTTNRTFSTEVGWNPITNHKNFAPGPSQIAQKLNGTAVTTGGVAVQSPAAFYVYNSVKIITAAAVTDKQGNVACAVPTTPYGLETAFNINTNAQAYFGGADIYGDKLVPTATIAEPDFVTSTLEDGQVTVIPTSWIKIVYATIYTKENGETITHEKPTGTVISMVTPFVYQPLRGRNGQTSLGGCAPPNDSEAFGYIPQTVLDFLIQNPQYSSQYPGLADCLPAGPSITPGFECPQRTTIVAQQPLNQDLTESTVVYVRAPGIRPDPTPAPVRPDGSSDSSLDSASNRNSEQRKPDNPVPVPVPAQPQNSPTGAAPRLGDIINSIFGGASNNAPTQAAPVPAPSLGPSAIGNPVENPVGNPVGNPVVIPAPTMVRVDNAPPGLTGEVRTSDGVPFIVVPGPTTVPAPAVLPAGAENIGRPTVIGGSSYVVISGPTNIPIAQAPAGAQGQTTYIAGVPYLAIPGPVTFAAPQAGGAGSIGRTTLIEGVPFVVIPGPTNIPVANAPAGLTGVTTTINGTPFLSIPQPTTVAVPAAAAGSSLGRTTLINGTPMVVIPGPTMIPVSGSPSNIQGAQTTTLNGTPYLVIPSQTTVPLSPSRTAGSINGQLTVIIDGSSRLIIAGPTTIPLNSNFPISGSTTVIDGTTMVVVTGATTVAAKTTSTTSSSTTSSATSSRPTAAETARESAPPSAGVRGMESSLGLVVLGALMAVFI